ncbi:MAG: recombination protein O N-terminal domain-containing protein [Thermodesulfobacteriota bacterium]|nr:recombination protein O N-terminal domain-containing protein [Thermodesulfobacteriota bacterium]
MLLDQTSAVVLKVADHGESDKIVTFYSPIRGKLTGIAKGLERNNLDFPFPNCITPLAGLTSPKSSP